MSKSIYYRLDLKHKYPYSDQKSIHTPPMGK